MENFSHVDAKFAARFLRAATIKHKLQGLFEFIGGLSQSGRIKLNRALMSNGCWIRNESLYLTFK